MKITKINIRITAFFMAVSIFILSFYTSAMSVYAKGGRDLYGTGSADEINIVKLLDMALNKGGMSMSPATIQKFLEYWWDAVVADLNTCINNVDTSITGTQAFVDAVSAALESSDHYDKLGDIIKKYLNFCLTMDYKSLSDFKQLLTQEGTFRKFLLSYVTDEDGNIAGTVDNKLKKYNLKSGFVNMVRKAADSYIEEYEGYYLVPTFTYKDISPTYFRTKELYDIFIGFLKKIDDSGVYWLQINGTYVYQLTDLSFTNTPNSNPDYGIFYVYLYDDNWNQVKNLDYWCYSDEQLSYFPDIVPENTKYKLNYTLQFNCDFSNLSGFPNISPSFLFTKDGRSVKVWKSLDAFKKYSVGKSDIYYSTQYSGFDYTVDNSIEFDYNYYTSNNYSHTVIQNNIDNSTDVNETTINNIVNNYITNNYYGSDESGGGGGSGGGSGNWFTDLITGIPELLSALIDGLAGIVDSVANLIEKLVNAFASLFVPSEESTNAVKEKVETKFSFITTSHDQITEISERFETMGTKSPTITFPLSKTWLADYGVEDVVVSFEWFEPYRYGFHSLLSAIMWIMFLFNQYFGLKNLIQGTSNFAGSLEEPEPEHHRAGFDLW